MKQANEFKWNEVQWNENEHNEMNLDEISRFHFFSWNENSMKWTENEKWNKIKHQRWNEMTHQKMKWTETKLHGLKGKEIKWQNERKCNKIKSNEICHFISF